MSRSCTRTPPITRLMSRSVKFSRRRSLSSRMRRFFFSCRMVSASSVNSGAKIASANCLESASASGPSTVRLTQMIPPNALSGSHAKALR